MNRQRLISGTRILKNDRILRKQAPQLVDPNEAEEYGIAVLSPRQLGVVHDLRRVNALRLTEGQLKTLEAVKFEALSRLYSDMFSGTVHIVNLAFRIADQNNAIVGIASADINTVISYANLAAPVISQYVSQYGPHSVTVSQTPLVAQVDVPTSSYNNGWLENWVSTIAKDSGLPPTDCLCILNPPQLVNTSAAVADGILGFHQFAHCPYLFVNLMGSGLTVDDRAISYAESLSHELAEMIVDPRANDSNPEVCDPCAGNCNNLFYNCFTLAGDYVGSVVDGQFSFPFDFYVSAVVQPDFVDDCPAPAITCTYWPEVWNSVGEHSLKQIAVASDKNNSLEVFGLGKDGAVYQIQQTGGEWGGWTSLLGQELRYIAVGANEDGRLELFAVGGDRSVYHIWQTPPNYVWGQWESLGGANAREISVLLDENLCLVLFALDSSGAVSVISQTQKNGLWGNWQPLAGYGLKQITAAVNSNNDLVLLALGGDGEVYFRSRNAGIWTAWGGIAGAKLSEIAVATDPSGALRLFGTGTDRTAWTCIQDIASGNWGAWTTLQGSQLKSVVAAPNENHCLDLFALGGDNRAYHITQQLPDNHWGNWVGLGATQQIAFLQLVPILDFSGELEVFGLSRDGTVFNISQTAKNGPWN